MRNQVMLVDGMALLFRAFYATALSGYYMINSNGTPTNAVHGFVKHLLTAVNTFKPSHLVCCWDMGSTTFRTELYSDYKGNRQAPPAELVPQFDLVKEVVASFDIPNIGLSGYEADDCIGTLARKYSKEADVSILTGDQDIFQLLNESISVILLKKGFGNYDVHTPETFLKNTGIEPNQMVDLKALMGDSSDNYPGVKGIGEKTASKLLQQYHSVEGILENIESLPKGQRNKIEQNLDMLHLSRKLAEIKCNVPITCELNEADLKINRNRVLETFADLEFKGLEKLVV